MLAIDHDNEARLFAQQTLLDHHARARFAQLLIAEHHVNRGVCFLFALRHHHAFTCGQAIGLDHNRRGVRFDIGMRRHRFGEGAVCSSGNVMAHHKIFGEIFGGFELRGGLGRAKYFEPRRTKCIDHTRCQGRFRANHGEIDFFLLREGEQLGDAG